MKCDFLKQFIQKTTSSSSKIRLNRPSTANIVTALAGGGAAVVSGTTIVKLDGGAVYASGAAEFLDLGATLDALGGALDDGAMKAKVAAMCDAISAAAYTLSTSAADVRKELADQPVYLQVQEGSIDNYKARFGKLPLMPISLSLYFLGDVPTPAAGGTNDDRLMPDHALGEPAFKLAYGVRGLLSGTGQVGFEQMPGVKAILDGYNGIAGARDQLDPERYLGFIRRIVSSLRLILDARNFRSMISVCSTFNGGLFSLPPLTSDGQGIVMTPTDKRTAAFPINKTAQEVITVVESSNQEDQAREMVSVVGGPAGVVASDRKKEQLFNLIDMNLVPINVHALQRSIPLVNVFNYSYTFEQYVCMLYGLTPDAVGKLEDATTTDTRQMFLRLLLEPYAPVTKRMYGSDGVLTGTGGFVARMFRGDNNLGMGRPKFLSDQLYNKALFGSIYPTQADYDEAGPPAGSAVARGRDNVGARRAYELARGIAQTLAQEVAALHGQLVAQQTVIVQSLNVHRLATAASAAAGGGAAGLGAYVPAGRGGAVANPLAVKVNEQFALWTGPPAALPATEAVADAALEAIELNERTILAQIYFTNAARIRSWPGRVRQIADTIGAVNPTAITQG